MNEQKKISVITVCFNSAATIRQTIESVLSQRYSAVEHVVVDGHSTDKTVSIIREYGDRLGKVVSEPDNGLYDAMNKGVHLASGDIIGILNSDDFFESDDTLACVAEYFDQNPDVDVVFGDVVFVDPDQTGKITRYYRANRFRPWKLRFGWMPPHPATFVRRSVYERFGDYRTDMKISADYEMFVRWLLKGGLSWGYLDKVLVRMRAGGVSTSGVRSSITLNKEIVRACRVNGVYTNLLLVLLKIPFKLLELVRRPA